MKATERRKDLLKRTDRPAPYLSGLVSLQAVSSSVDEPDITVYRATSEEAFRWRTDLVNRGGFTTFLHRDRAEEEWEVFDETGLYVERNFGVSRYVSEAAWEVKVDRESFEAEIQRTLIDPGIKLLSCVESHQAASSADHSNFQVLCRRLLIDAPPEDLHHFYVADSRSWECRVTGLFADLSKVSVELQDTYLDRWKWTNAGWPLQAESHLQTLADRLSKFRNCRVIPQLIIDCGHYTSTSRVDLMRLQLRWTQGSPSLRYAVAQDIVRLLQRGIEFQKGKKETFDPDVVKTVAGQVLYYLDTCKITD